MDERKQTKTPPVVRSADEYISLINPKGKRVLENERPNLGMGDMYGMAPKGARHLNTINHPELGPVRFIEKGGDVYALAYNPDVGEQDVIGYAMRRGDGTELHVVDEAQGQGIGAELSYHYRRINPLAPSGGLTEGGEAAARKTYDRLVQEGVLSGDPDITKAEGGEVESGAFSPVPSFVPYYEDPEYQNWFGKSKTHREGVPVTYYTGTSKDKDFDKFNVGRHGAWFTADPSEASEYAKRNDSQGYKRGYGWEMIPTNTASRVIPVHLKIENPYTGPLPESVLSGNYKKAQSDWFDTLRAKGHDGWIPEQYGGQLAVVLKEPHQIKSVNNRTWDPKNPRMDKAGGGEVEDDGIAAYHGSPHDYPAERLIRSPEGQEQYIVGQPGALPDVPQGATVMQDFPLGRMRMDKIGTGEGAQAYGHGLYTAEAEPVAKGYRDQLALKKNQMTLVDKITGEPLAEDVPGYGPVQDFFNTYAYDLRDGDRKHRMSQWDSWKEGAARQLKDWENFRSHPDYADPETAKWAEEQMDGFRKQIADYDAAQKLLPKIIAKPLGHMYEVRINAHPDHFLDWERPLSEQGGMERFLTLPDFARPLDDNEARNVTGQTLYGRLENKLGPQKAALALRSAGIPGIKYLDAGSRGAGEGSRNYVVFDDKLVDIKRKYADGGVVEEASGSAEPPKQPAKRKGRASSVIVGERSPIVDRALMLVSRKA